MTVYPEQQYYDGYSGYPQVTAGRCGDTIKKVGCEGDDCIKVMKLSEFMKEMKHDPLKCGSDDDCAKCPECRDKEVEYDSDEDIEEYDDEIILTVQGNGFLYNMVRIIAGTLVDVGLGIKF